MKAKEIEVSATLIITQARKFTCEFSGSVAEYAMMWLNLSNNRRENRNEFLYVGNNYDNDVYVVTTVNMEQPMREYLEGIGLTVREVTDCDSIDPIIWTDYNDCRCDYDIDARPYYFTQSASSFDCDK